MIIDLPSHFSVASTMWLAASLVAGDDDFSVRSVSSFSGVAAEAVSVPFNGFKWFVICVSTYSMLIVVRRGVKTRTCK